jgi:hypothetical protein
MPTKTAELKSKDVLAISTLKEKNFNQQLFAGSPYAPDEQTLTVRKLSPLEKAKRWVQGDWNLEMKEAERYFSSNQSWRGFMSYRSPWDKARVVVVAAASDNAQLTHLYSDLRSNAVNAAIRGDTAIISGADTVRSFRVAPQFPSGQLPWYQVIVWYASQYSAAFAVLTALLSLVFGLPLYRALTRRARRRLTPKPKPKPTARPQITDTNSEK